MPDSIIRLIHKTVHLCGSCRINDYFKAMVKAGGHRLHVQNAYLLYILRMPELRYPTVVIALWSVLLTFILCVTKGSQFTMPKKYMFCVIVQDPSSLLRNTCSTEETSLLKYGSL